MTKSKPEVRKKLINLRNNMDLSKKAEKEAKIIAELEKIIKSSVNKARLLNKEFYILAYRAKGNEVNLIRLCSKIWKGEYTGIKLAFPKIENKRMEFYTASSEADFSLGHFGILEPKTENTAVCKIDFKTLVGNKNNRVIVLVPGVAFSEAGYRMGYGAGYYDRYFENTAEFKNVRLLGIAFDFQIYDIPYDEHDIKMEQVISA
jgi:5-formyltetrahydrofolate cyclo-ligase